MSSSFKGRGYQACIWGALHSEGHTILSEAISGM